MVIEKQIILLLLLFLKHFVVDFVISTKEMSAKKGENLYYLLLHSAEHGLFSFIILVFFINFKIALVVILFEIFVHSLFDFIKSNKNLLGKYIFPSKLYFIFFGLDQFFHQLTYLLICLFIFNK